MHHSRLVPLAALALAVTTTGWSPAAPPGPPTASATHMRGQGHIRDPGSVFPTPQVTRQRDDFVTVTRTVTVVTGHDPDAPALRATRQALRAAGAQRIVTAETEHTGPTQHSGRSGDRAGQLTVRLGEDTRGGLGSEGYALTMGGGSRHSAGHIVLAGHDGTGTYYAAQSLRQVLPASRHPGIRVRGLTMRDWPATRSRGVIQGFYGTAWSQRAQLDQLDYYGAHKLNTYLYSPKDDPYLRERWRDPYPRRRLADLAELVERAGARHVDFGYALSPGLSVCYSSAADAKALTEKLASMWRIGVRTFVIPLDDISYTEWNCAEDGERFGTGGAAAARAHAHLVNTVEKEFIDTHPGAAPLQMVPTEYAGTAPKPYKRELARRLSPDVTVQWTGSDVVSPSVTAAQARKARATFGHPVVLWDNYPVNDYATDRLLLGPYTGRGKDVPEHLEGIVANPMIQPSASKIALGTVADYAWNARAYRPRSSWTASLRELSGGDAGVERALRAFADVNHSSVLDKRQGPGLRTAVRDYWRDERAASGLDAALKRLQNAPAVLDKGLPDRRFLRDARPWLDAARDWARADRTALRMLTAARDGDGERAWQLRRELPQLVERAESHRYVDIDGERIPAVVGEGVLDVFAEDAVAAHDVLLGRTPRPKASTDMGTHQQHTPLRMTDGSDDTWYWNKAPMEKGSYVRIDLRAPRPLGQVRLAMGAPDARDDIIGRGVLEHSADGSHWTRFASFHGEREVTARPPEGTRARYVRARAVADQDALVAVRAFEADGDRGRGGR
ncbi:beta-N-acetylglucosaminidase domain-containing protein [Streptomyces tubbatahanensis]|uniref:Beta-N-acetylglucosaminidase domain-containing protein n=1 Tax=Streptomyces tubbatahanensis TaxID=2923272 RepID=A0ABY3Y1X3_9ACTN|nr:beta-N-acetylglucosaminidase domain-containing protein [Streptomyces tubbatahanensis]UNT00585.1 beta-N-acetylglucosaminidase domain-containing protein [Streptomyces tubbatahanensis]